MVIDENSLSLIDSVYLFIYYILQLGWFLYPIFDELPNKRLEEGLMIKKYELTISGYIITKSNTIKDLYDSSNTNCHLIENEQFEYDIGGITTTVYIILYII